jgi:hypothetical protein
VIEVEKKGDSWIPGGGAQVIPTKAGIQGQGVGNFVSEEPLCDEAIESVRHALQFKLAGL